MKKILFIMFFFTSLAFSQVLTEGFEGTSGPTGGTWTLDSGTWARFEVGTPGFQWAPTTANPNSGSRAAFMVKQNGVATEDWLVTPQVLVPANGQLRFYNRLAQNANQGNMFYIMVSTTSQTDPTTFTQVAVFDEEELMDEPAAGNGGSGAYNIYNQITLPLTAYVGDNVYIAFKSTQIGGGDSWYLDDVVVDQVCITPSAITTSNITATSATISWTDTNSASSFEIEYGPVGFTPGTGTVVTATTNPYTLTGLTSISSYDFYITTLCSPTNSSEQSDVTTFNTTALPPICGGNFVDNGGASANYLSSSNQTITICPDNPNESVIVTFLSFITEEGYDALYVYNGTTATAANIISSGNGPGNVIGGQAGGFWGDLNDNLPGPFISATPGGCLTFKFRSDSSLNLAGWLANISCASCVLPTNLATSNIQMDTATLTWTDNNIPAATAWEVVVQPVNSGLPTAASIIIPATTNPFTLPAGTLTAGTSYEFYVRAVCSASSSSGWSTPKAFNTVICDPTDQCLYVFDTWDTFGDGWNGNTMSVLQNGIEVGLITGPTTADGENHIQFSVALCHDIPFTLEWNSGGNFAGEVGIEIIDPFTESVYIKNPGEGSQGTTLYSGLANCIPPPCPKPINLSFSNSTETSTILNWTEVGTASQWTVEYGPIGFAQGTGTTVTVSAPLPYTLQGLNSGTLYQFYVQADCGATDGLSTWSGPGQFATQISNDECVDAIVVIPNSNLNCNNFSSGLLSGATGSLESNNCGGNDDDDVWFEFVATATTHFITLGNIVGDQFDLDFVLYEGDQCSNLTQLLCSGATTQEVTGLTVGSTYKLRVYSGTSTTNMDTSFEVCITTPSMIVDNTTYTVEELITDVLINSPCAQVSNITFKTGTTNGANSSNGIAYFQDSSNDLPFNSGIILSTGDAMRSSGPNTSGLSDGTSAWTGDAELFSYMQGLGIDPFLNSYNNATVIEFDFVPLIDNISFNFMFASEEYGTFQCDFSDAFAFFLTDVTSGTTTNLAVLPGTTIPVSVVTIRDNTYNGGCASANEQYFDVFNGFPNDPNLATTNYNGQTVELIAQSSVTPLNTYHIKLVIADRNDTSFDSAVFLKENSFDLGNVDLGSDYLESEDNALCNGEDILIESGLNTSLYSFTWEKDGIIIPGETGPSLTVNQEGVYSVNATYIGTTCASTDSVIVDFYDTITIGQMQNLTNCESTSFALFDLTLNSQAAFNGLDTSSHSISFYENLADAEAGQNLILTPNAYTNTIADLQTIYVVISNINNGCSSLSSFTINVSSNPDFTITNDFEICNVQNQTITVTPLNFTDAEVIYSWTKDGVAIANTTNTIANVTEGVYEVTVNKNGCIATASTIVTIGEIVSPNFDMIDDLCSGSLDTLLPNASVNGVTGIWSPSVINSEIPGTTTYTFTPNNLLCFTITSLDVTVISCGIPKGISPNGDGKNDFFDLSAYNVSKLEIFNRYGTKVYSKIDYSNEWGGTTDTGKELPSGTYFYSIQFKDSEPKTGWVYINREL